MEQNTAETATAAIEATTAGDATATAVVEAKAEEVVESVEETKPKRQNKWTKEYEREYMRNYMRERWRRVNGVKPENYLGERRNVLEEAAKYGEEAVKFYKHLQEQNNAKKKKKPRKPVEMMVCPVCLVEHRNTEGTKKQHAITIRHRHALELNEKRAQAERGEP
jgi:hypothetical protein